MSRTKHRMPSRARIAIAIALLALFVALGGGAWAVQNPKSQGVSRAASVVLTRDATDVSHTLFTIGRVTVTAHCFDNGSGGVQLAVKVETSADGPVLVGPFGHGPVKDSDPIVL